MTTINFNSAAAVDWAKWKDLVVFPSNLEYHFQLLIVVSDGPENYKDFTKSVAGTILSSPDVSYTVEGAIEIQQDFTYVPIPNTQQANVTSDLTWTKDADTKIDFFSQPAFNVMLDEALSYPSLVKLTFDKLAGDGVAIQATGLADTLALNAQDNIVFADTGDDAIYGAGGNDVLRGK